MLSLFFFCETIYTPSNYQVFQCAHFSGATSVAGEQMHLFTLLDLITPTFLQNLGYPELYTNPSS